MGTNEAKAYEYSYRQSSTNLSIVFALICFALYLWFYSVAQYDQVQFSQFRLGECPLIKSPELSFHAHVESLDVSVDTVTRSNKAFAKYKHFDEETIEEKVMRWQLEFNYRIERSKNDGMHASILKYALSLNRDAVIVDSGGHVGDTTLPVLDMLHKEHDRADLKLVIIEPDESKCTWIRFAIHTRYRHMSDSIEVVSSGLWSHETRASLERDHNHPGAWFVTPDVFQIRKHKLHNGPEPVPGEIPLLSIYDILPACSRFGLWHLDVEGSEMRAILGMGRTYFRPIVIFESFTKPGVDSFAVGDQLKYLYGYKLVDRIKPNSDRVMVPPHAFDSRTMKEMPFYV